ncbi:MAG: hypothetical protein IKH55_01860 [Fibrobacter sp.]|nr:hypothetical protein [Fibrobacter sp.]
MECVLKNLESIFGIIESIAVVVGAFVALYQWNNQKKIQKVSLLEECSNSIMKNPDIAEIIHKIEWKEKIGFNGKEFCNMETERKVDCTLTIFSNFLVKVKLVDCRDFYFSRYLLKHTLENDEIQSYLKFLLDDAVDGIRDDHPYKHLLDYGKEIQLKGEIYK